MCRLILFITFHLLLPLQFTEVAGGAHTQLHRHHGSCTYFLKHISFLCLFPILLHTPTPYLPYQQASPVNQHLNSKQCALPTHVPILVFPHPILSRVVGSRAGVCTHVHCRSNMCRTLPPSPRLSRGSLRNNRPASSRHENIHHHRVPSCSLSHTHISTRTRTKRPKTQCHWRRGPTGQACTGFMCL